ncbi:hypothetical protein J008_07055 [Cryptococcus neoformans]|nr:hypothetical protein C362_07025 [Cryptococcus neoformans var. grubii Bt1]OXH21015.1 hypothetical protein J008_07055 [Cryptococcus neoformans var. grubii]
MKDKPCTLTLEDGTYYDLTQLASAKGDYVANVGDITYILNVCRKVVSQTYRIDEPENVGALMRDGYVDFSMGEVNTTLTLSPMTDEPMIIMTDGSICPNNPGQTASTAIRFICSSQSDFYVDKPIFITSLPPQGPCQFYFEWNTPLACRPGRTRPTNPTNPTSPKGGLETHNYYFAFGAIVVIAILTWFGGLTLYNRLYLKRRGLSQFPLPSFDYQSISLPPRNSAEHPGPNWDSSRRRPSRSGGYRPVQTEGHDREERFAPRFSLDDGD